MPLGGVWQISTSGSSPENLLEPVPQFLLAVLARRIERRWVRVAQPGDMITRDLHGPAVKIVKAELAAEPRDVGLRFMIPRKDVHAFRALLKNRPHGVQAAAKIRQVPSREIVIRFDSHQFFERGLVAVDVGKDQELHVN